MLKSLKISVSLIILGNILYWALGYFTSTSTSPFSEFLTGILLGLSIGINIIGIILLILYIVKSEKNKKD